MAEKKIGIIEDYFAKIGVAVVNLTDGDVKVGDKVHITGHTTDLIQEVKSMQIEHKGVNEAGKGDIIGLKVDDRVRKHDTVFLITED